MGRLIKSRKFNWQPLENSFNEFAAAINTNRPIEGSGIRITEGAAGSIIEVSPNGGSGGGPDSITWGGVKWIQVDVMDASCSRQTIWVLQRTGKKDDTVTVGPLDNDIALA